MKQITSSIVIALLLSTPVHSQSDANTRQSPSKIYWLKYTLIFFRGCPPRVFPDNIIFTEGDCSTDAYSGDILPRGTKVEITAIGREKRFAKVSFKHLSAGYEIFLKNNNGKSFRKSFDLLFSEKEFVEWYDTECPDDIKTKKQLIKCIGFPIRIDNSSGVEQYFYILEFAGPGNPFMGYDGFTVEIKNGKIINVSGYI